MKNILILAPDFPFPPNHGGRLDVYRIIDKLIEFGNSVDLVSTTNHKEIDYSLVKLDLNNLYVIPRNLSFFNMLNLKPFQISSRPFSLKNDFLSKEYDVVICFTEYMSEFAKKIPAKYKILRVQNDEALYFSELMSSTKNLIKKFYLFLESQKFRLFQDDIHSLFDELWYISSEEYIHSKSKEKAFFCPVPVKHIPEETEGEPDKKQINTCNDVLFVGSFFMPNNIQGIDWYIRNIHKKILKKIPNYRLILTGNSRGKDISRYLKHRSVVLIDSPESLDNIYNQATVFINPMLKGAGVKLKTLEAIANKLPIVSTSIGAQGIGLQNGKDIFITNDSEMFMIYVIDLLKNRLKRKRMISNAVKHINKTHNFDDFVQSHPKF